MSDRTGFIARGFSRLGPLTVTHGLGNPGSPPFFLPAGPEVPADHEVEGTKGPKAVATNKDAPRFDVHYPARKKKSGRCR